MPITITRIYDTEDKARQAEAELRQHPPVGQVTVVTPSDGAAAEAKLAANGLSAASAKVYAEAVNRDRSVVSVAPGFGRAAAVAQVLDSIGPVDTHIADVPETVTSRRVRSATPAGNTGTATARASTGNDPAPLSSRFGWPLLSDDPTPASNKFGWRVLLNNPAPLSSLLGLPTLSANQDANASLSDDPAPLSNRAGWRLLLNNPAPVSDRFGWRTLKDDPTPLSSWLGWRTLSENQSPSTSLIDNPAPLSTLFGLPVLLREQTKRSERPAGDGDQSELPSL